MENSMKNMLRNIAAAGVLAGIAAAPISATAASAMIENAKSQCIVGEQADGYIGFVPGADIPDDLRREVRDTNQARKAFYADLSKRNGVTIEVAAALTAEKLMQQAGPGECIRMQDGSWVEV